MKSYTVHFGECMLSVLAPNEAEAIAQTQHIIEHHFDEHIDEVIECQHTPQPYRTTDGDIVTEDDLYEDYLIDCPQHHMVFTDYIRSLQEQGGSYNE